MVNNKKSNKQIWLVVFAVAVVVALLVYYLVTKGKDCAFSGWKKTIGVDLNVAVGGVQAIKSKVGITDVQIRDFDAIMKDFALKYDANCVDYNQGRMNLPEYQCRRNNMEKTLDKIRIFLQEVEAAKVLSDASTQRDVILRALDDLKDSKNSNYSSGCTASLVVDPTKLHFANNFPERTVQISNSGNNSLIFTVANLPDGFIAKPNTGEIEPGKESRAVAIYRTILPPSSKRPLTFNIRSNFQEEVAVQIDLDLRNAQLYQSLADQTLAVASSQKREPSVQDALLVIDQSMKSGEPVSSEYKDAMRYFLAAGVLSRLGKSTQAKKALDKATIKDPTLVREPSTLILKGIVFTQSGFPDKAIEYFAQAKRLAPENDTEKTALADLLTGAIMLKTDRQIGTQMLSQPNVQISVKQNPQLLDFASRQLHVKDLDKAVLNAPSIPQ